MYHSIHITQVIFNRDLYIISYEWRYDVATESSIKLKSLILLRVRSTRAYKLINNITHLNV
jgi:hypothetical protein